MSLGSGDWGSVGSIGGYTLVDRLGKGGMGVVFLARAASGRLVAVKVVHAQHAQDEEFRARFRQEVAAARRVSGAFTAPVVDADPDAELPWMATLYVPGHTLTEIVEKQGPLDGRRLRTLALGLVEALRDIHQAGLVHRDLKPSNVLMAGDGPRVIDFGISRAADNQSLTVTGRLMGTPPFMSPEQFAAPRDVSTASDVFSLGSVLVYAATGNGPFDAASPYMTGYQVMHEAPSLGGVPEPLRSIAALCLEKDPAVRPRLAELHGMLQRLPDSPRPPSPPEPTAADTRLGFPSRHDAGFPTHAGPADGDGTTVTTGGTVWPGSQPGHGSGGRRRRIPVVLAATVAVAGLSFTGVQLTSHWGGTAAQGRAGSPTGPPATPSPELPAGWQPWRTSVTRDVADGADFTQDTWCESGGSDLACAGTNFTVAGIDPASGSVRWQPGIGSRGALPVGARDGVVYVYEFPESLAGASQVTLLDALDSDTGKRLWSHKVGGNVDPAHVFDGGVLTLSPSQREFVAYGTSGKELWRSPVTLGQSCAPTVLGDAPYALCTPDGGGDDAGFVLLQLDPSNGTPRDLPTLPTSAVPLGAADGRLLFAVARDDKDGSPYKALLRVDPNSGKSEPVPLAGTPSGTPTLIDGVVYFVREDGTVTAASAADGTQLWRRVTEMENLSAPVVSAKYGTVCFVNRFGRLLALDSATGAERWRTAALDDPGDPTVTPQILLVQDAIVAVAGNTVFSVRPDRPPAAN